MPYTAKAHIPYLTHSATSAQAAEQVEQTSSDSHRWLIRHHIKACPDGATCDEVEIALRLRHQTASARIRDLVLDGLLFDSGVRRETRSGAKARVYSAAAVKEPT
jgi:hypothetical protein